MDTVANTHRQNEKNRYLQIPNRKKKLKHHFVRQARHMRASRIDFYGGQDLFDLIREDAEVMKNFFSWLAFSPFRIEEIRKAGFDYLLYSGCSSEEKERFKVEFDGLFSFQAMLLSFQSFVEEKAYYYAGLSEQLDEIGKYRDGEAETN